MSRGTPRPAHIARRAVIVPSGGGAVNAAGDVPGTIGTTAATSVTLAPHTAAIVLK